jgi:hypothetical protein
MSTNINSQLASYATLHTTRNYQACVTLTHNTQISNHATEMRSAKRENTEKKLRAKMCVLIQGQVTETN